MMNPATPSINEKTSRPAIQGQAHLQVRRLELRIRLLLGFFMAALVISGLTAVPLRWEAEVLAKYLGEGSSLQPLWPALASWISYVHQGLTETFRTYPFIQYGTDWLAFAHIVIATSFIGPLRDPIRNIWVVEFGMIACLLVIPAVLVFAPLRGIPLFWQLLDISFGVFGLVPLWLVRRDIRTLERIAAREIPLV